MAHELENQRFTVVSSVPIQDASQNRHQTLPRAPATVQSVGLDPGLLQQLALKIFYYSGNATAREISRRIALPVPTTIEILDSLRKERLCDVLGGESAAA